jgi:photosystem II stability/assembly factor-like uncharacterized protein
MIRSVISRRCKGVLYGLFGAGLWVTAVLFSPAAWGAFDHLQKREGFVPPRAGLVAVYPLNGPVTGAGVMAFATDRRRLFAGTFGDGVFRSEDGGDSWRPVREGLEDPFILSLLIGPDGAVYAGTVRKGVFKLMEGSDGTGRWVRAGEGLQNPEIPVLVWSRDTLYAGTGGGVHKSTDGAKHWTPVNAGMTEVLVRSLAVTSQGVMYAGTGGKGIFQSRDGGRSWEGISQGLRDEGGLRENFIRSLFLDPDGGLYAGTFGGGIFKTMDSGKQWFALNDGLSNYSIRGIARSDDGTFYTATGDGVFRSSDGGGFWEPINGGQDDRIAQSLHLAPDHTVYIGTAGGIWRTRDQGETWTSLHRGLFLPTVRAVAVDGQKALYAGTAGSGVFRSLDDGATWKPFNNGLTDKGVTGLLWIGGTTLLCGTQDGLYKSEDQGKSWVRWGFENQPVGAMIQLGSDLYVGNDKGLSRWSASQSRWETVGPKKQGVSRLVEGLDRKLYAAISQDLYRLEGIVWKRLWSGEPIEGVAADPKGAVYVATAKKLLKKSPAAESWEPVALPTDASLRTIHLQSRGSELILYLGTAKGLYFSPDGGKQWKKAEGVSADTAVVVIHPHYSGVLLIGSDQEGLLLAADRFAKPVSFK